jgi:hypothetical protein
MIQPQTGRQIGTLFLPYVIEPTLKFKELCADNTVRFALPSKLSEGGDGNLYTIAFRFLSDRTLWTSDDSEPSFDDILTDYTVPEKSSAVTVEVPKQEVASKEEEEESSDEESQVSCVSYNVLRYKDFPSEPTKETEVEDASFQQIEAKKFLQLILEAKNEAIRNTKK